MKLANENKFHMRHYIFLLIGLIFICSCQNKSTATNEELESAASDFTELGGKWIYRDITKNDTSIGPFESTDTMYIDFESHRFLYDIEKLQKHSAGSFSLEQDSMTEQLYFDFHYDSSAVAAAHTRNFNIELGTNDSLIISEGPLKFYYSR